MEYNEDEGDFSGNSSKEKFYKWGKEDIVILLQYYEDFVRNSVFSKRKLLWITLSKQLQEHGVPVDAVQCENKWKALCRAYRNQYKSFQYRETIERILSLNNTDNSLLTLEKESSVPVKRIKAEYDTSIDISDEFEEKTQCKLWTPQEVEVLLKVMEANIPVFCKYSKKIIYEKVAHQLKMYKITVNALNIEHKWKGLIRALRRRITQKQKKTEIDLRVEKLHKIMLAYENSTEENSPEQEINEEMPNEGNTYHTLTNSKSSGSGIMTLLRSSSEIVTAFPLEQEYNQQDYLDENLSMESIQTEPQQPRTEIIDENMTFEERLLRFLKEQEDAKQRRHDEKMELKRKKIGLLEALVQSQNKDPCPIS